MEWLCDEVPQKIIPYDIIEWKYEKQTFVRVDRGIRDFNILTA
jgi:hypothetical protein